MRRCPKCRRDYFDDTLIYCLEDGSLLVGGLLEENEQVTEFLPFRKNRRDPASSPNRTVGLTRSFIVLGTLCLVLAASFLGYRYLLVGENLPDATGSPQPAVPSKHYWEMVESEQHDLIRQRVAHVFALMGDEPVELNDEEVASIKEQLDRYVKRRGSLSQEQFEEGLRTIFGRASQYAGLIKRSFEMRKVPAILGIYQAMVESEYRDCPSHPHERGPVGLFQFSRKVAERYDITSSDYCNVEKQVDGAARHMSDLLSDFGSEKGNWTLALLSFNNGTDTVRGYLRETRSRGVTERTYWAIRRDRKHFNPPLRDEDLGYVIRFLAAAVIGETPSSFDLQMSPLSTH